MAEIEPDFLYQGEAVSVGLCFNCVQIVNFNLKDMTDAEFRSMANEVAPAFASVP